MYVAKGVWGTQLLYAGDFFFTYEGGLDIYFYRQIRMNEARFWVSLNQVTLDEVPPSQPHVTVAMPDDKLSLQSDTVSLDFFSAIST